MRRSASHARAANAISRHVSVLAWLEATEADAPKNEHVRLSRVILRSTLGDVVPSGEAMVVDGERIYVKDRGWVDRSTRPVLLRIARFLLTQRASHPATASSVNDILTAGWPGEKIRADAGAIRVRVALAHLRKVTFGRTLVRSRQGWYLQPS